ncbi:MAG: hypothetical protein WBF71_11095 [Microthrixaceae bacterium]
MTSRPRRRRIGHALLVVVGATAILASVGCTSAGNDDPAVVTLPENNTTTLPPATRAPGGQAAPEGPTEPPEVQWVTQIGGAGDDSFNSVTGAGADVVATGVTSQGVNEPTAGGTDVLTARVDSEGKIDKLSQFGSAADDNALAVTSLNSQSRAGQNGTGPGGVPGTSTIPSGGAIPPGGTGPDGTAPDGTAPNGTAPDDGTVGTDTLPIACGTTLGSLGSSQHGAIDAWCGPAETGDRSSGVLGEVPGIANGITQMGGEGNDSITGLAQAGSSSRSNQRPADFFYMSGATDGFYPGAEDPAGQGLGGGDALAFRSSMDGSASWIRQFGTQSADSALGVCAVGSEGFYVGWTEGDLSGQSKGGRDAWISLIDASGIQRWITQFGSAGDDEFRAVANAGEAARGTMQLIAVGSSTGDVDAEGPTMNSGRSDAIAASFAPDGSVLWSRQFGSGLDDSATGVVVDGSTIYVTGTTSSAAAGADGVVGQSGTGDSTTTTTEPPVKGLGDLDTTIGEGGAKDVFLAALNAETGEILWIVRLGSDKDDVATGITATGNGLLVISGTTNGQLGDNVPAGGNDGFLLAFPLPAAGGAAASSV